jgi:hypothetical protein
MSYTAAQLTALRTAAASGVTRVTYDGQTVEYRSVDELLKMIGRIEAALTPQRVTHVNPIFQRSTYK